MELHIPVGQNTVGGQILNNNLLVPSAQLKRLCIISCSRHLRNGLLLSLIYVVQRYFSFNNKKYIRHLKEMTVMHHQRCGLSVFMYRHKNRLVMVWKILTFLTGTNSKGPVIHLAQTLGRAAMIACFRPMQLSFSQPEPMLCK